MRWLPLVLLLSSPFTAVAAESPEWHRLVGLLQYLEGDYPGAVAAQSPEELTEQRDFAKEAVKAATELKATAYLERLESIRARIEKAEDPAGVSKDCGDLARTIAQEQQLAQAPKQLPSLEAGAKVYAASCVVCHGEKGDGKTAIAPTLNPPPSSFHDPERMGTLTPYRAFNTVSFGITGTAMAPFGAAMSERDRWNLAFYVFTFRQPACDHAPPRATLEQLANSTDEALAKQFGEAEVACLRRRLEAPKDDEVLAVASRGIRQARSLSAAGDHDGARKALIDAYLLGVEPVEPAMRARAPEYVAQLEAAFTRARVAAQSGTDFDAATQSLEAVLAKAPVSGHGTGGDSAVFWSVFVGALLILLREGFEAVVVVGALLAVLKKMNATAQARVVHLGWASALVAGAVLYVFGRAALAGANREWLETVVAFAAVGLLLYAALWLNARANMSQFMGELRGQMQTALGAGGGFGLFVVSFSSVLRESVETALFLQGLAQDSASGTAWGAIAGLVVLGLLLVLIRQVGFVLPMKTMFRASTALLCATAVFILGKAVHGAQELGLLQLAPVGFVRVDVLGVFPDALSLGAQAALAAALLVYWWRTGKKPRPAVA